MPAWTIIPDDSLVVPGQKVRVTVRLTTRERIRSVPTDRMAITSGVGEHTVGEMRRKGKEWAAEYSVLVSPAARLTYPRATHLYAALGSSQSLEAHAHWGLKGSATSLSQNLDLEIAPPHLITIDPPAMWVSPQTIEKGIKFKYSIRNMQSHPKCRSVKRLALPKDG